MKAQNTSAKNFRTLAIAGVLFSVGQFVSVPSALAEERQFLIMLAHSPKQFAGGEPAHLDSSEAIRKQYFDQIDPAIDSFAEYWEELSYGDVTISGDVTDWIALPWRIEIDPAIATTDAGIPFFDLDGNGTYVYGRPELFSGKFSQAIGDAIGGITGDIDGDPNGAPNGPFGPASGSGHTTLNGLPVWKPGERFIDMDRDGAWDALDERNNMMDWDGDGRPDLDGHWINLNGDGLMENESDDCLYLRDSDNSTVFDYAVAPPITRDQPDCCPNGPGTPGCDCHPTRWTTPVGEFVDCNGNLIPDVCDVAFPDAVAACAAFAPLGFVSCTRPDCFQDTSPLDAITWLPAPDGIPDECQFSNWNAIPAPPGGMSGCLAGRCIPLTGPAANPPNRCEFDDSNNDGEIDLVEPWEDFLRRWNPCIHDIDADPRNRFEDQIHWIKVYDPSSPHAGVVQTCNDPPATFAYGSPAYIRDNYPAKPADVLELIGQAGDVPERSMWGSADPGDVIPPVGPPFPPLPGTTAGCAQWLIDTFGCICHGEDNKGRPCGPAGNSYGTGNLCLPEDRQTALMALGIPLSSFPCDTADASACDPSKVIPDYCFLGFHHQFDPPDSWTDVTPENVPDGQVFSAKMQVEAGEFCNATKSPPLANTCRAGFVPAVRTPEPGTQLADRPWFEQFWRERYRLSASLPPFQRIAPASLPSIAPPWDGGNPGDNIPQVRLFPDVEPAGVGAATTRRYFAANRGGRNGNGTGWKAGSCGAVLAPIVLFETGDLADGFATLCNAPILPEEVNGTKGPRQFFDGWVEYDDLPSSKYHRAGDQRLGEVTSPRANNTGIFGQDIGPHVSGEIPIPDGRIAAAGPLAVNIHGNGGFDAGNMLNIELLTWRTQPPFNDGEAWETELEFDGQFRFHPYAGPKTGVNLGFRDYNLDGLVDLGESRYEGTENYTADVAIGTNDNGVTTQYPWHRSRLIEDCVEVNDRLLDFDDFVDQVALDAVECVQGVPSTLLPPRYGSGSISPDGLTSGIVLLPPGAHRNDVFPWPPDWRPIHNNDNDNAAKSLGNGAEKIGWNTFFHTLVRSIDSMAFFETSDSGAFLTRFAAHEYGHAWQGFPDLYDYDVFNNPELENAPVGLWDTMANGEMVHVVPPLKATTCASWIEPIDLTTVLTPGVDTTITIPPYETVRDGNTYFLENPAFVGERYYFYSVGQGMDAPDSPNGGMPGEGLIILHTDEGANPGALPSGQPNPSRFSFLVVQADGLGELEAPGADAPGNPRNRGDASDPWPGTLGRTQFNFNTTPAATWYAQNAWIGLDVLDIVPDGAGSIQLTLNWQPTNISSLRFRSPPVGASDNGVFTVTFDATDLHGGTTIELYYTSDPDKVTISPGNGHFIGSMQKTDPGTQRLSMDWNISGLADDTYYIFAKLIEGQGAHGPQESSTNAIPARDNVSNGVLKVTGVDIAGNKARTETWTVRLVSVENGLQDWIVNGSLSQPAPADQSAVQVSCRHLLIGPNSIVGQYVTCGGEVSFTLENDVSPVNGVPSFALGDRWSFVTTGITAPSSPITIHRRRAKPLRKRRAEDRLLSPAATR